MSDVPRIKLPTDSEEVSGHSSSPSIKPPQFGIGRWINYINSAEYQRIQPGNGIITESELISHNKSDDLWMALNHGGKRAVFDITPFACCHPGGLDVLLEHAGTDASEAFRMAHAYVNVDMVGRLRKGFLAQTKSGAGSKRTQLKPSMIVPHLPRQSQIKPKWEWVISDANTVNVVIYYPKFTSAGDVWSYLDQLRFLAHWLPPTECAHTPNVMQRGQLLVRTLLNGAYHKLELRLVTMFEPRLSTIRLDVTQNKDGSKAQLTVQLARTSASDNKPISTIGSVMLDSLVPVEKEADVNLNLKFFRCNVVESRRISGTPYRLIRLAWSDDVARVAIPLGHHVVLRLVDKTGQPICRPYTPVWPQSILNTDNIQADLSSGTELTLLVKIYPNGLMSQLIDQLEKGTSVECSLPMGYFPCELLHTILSPTEKNERPTVIMLSAGSGITPMLRFLPVLLSPDSQSCEANRVCLVCFDRTEGDQILRTELTDLQFKFHERFRIQRVLSDPQETPTVENPYLTGTLNESLCRICLFPSGRADKSEDAILTSAFWFICGPPGFNEIAANLVHQWNVPDTNVFIFKG